MKSEISHSEILAGNAVQIEVEDALAKGYLLIDVRSAAEFSHGTIPGAVNVPLFDEDERSVIGTIYKHGGHEQAIDRGFGIVKDKLTELLGAFEQYAGRKIAVFCARGGMRSLSVVNLLNQSGYEAFQLRGGYKKHRHDVLERLEKFRPRLIVIHGLTGTGKTRILQNLEDNIDLEELARHRSSIFGGLDREPSNQRDFESKLALSIVKLNNEPYFIEGESRKIGRVFMPKPLAIAMKKGILVNVHCSLETRISRILEDYPVENSERVQELALILKSLKQKMGSSKVEQMIGLLRNGEIAELVRILLVEYYDKRYKKSMSNYSFGFELSSENISEAAAQLQSFKIDVCKS